MMIAYWDHPDKGRARYEVEVLPADHPRKGWSMPFVSWDIVHQLDAALKKVGFELKYEIKPE
tara:strand:+ start:407 stop:592 length:186 start_codon:yes stop_codon:yes gene_type:complete